MKLLDSLRGPQDLKELGQSELTDLAAEIRDCLTSAVSASSGHLGANLGVVELTIALHRVFDSPREPPIFGVAVTCTLRHARVCTPVTTFGLPREFLAHGTRPATLEGASLTGQHSAWSVTDTIHESGHESHGNRRPLKFSSGIPLA
jgi:deoxyxylulose-5-phosphate synthase